MQCAARSRITIEPSSDRLISTGNKMVSFGQIGQQPFCRCLRKANTVRESDALVDTSREAETGKHRASPIDRANALGVTHIVLWVSLVPPEHAHYDRLGGDAHDRAQLSAR